jgi:hypothetical protein
MESRILRVAYTIEFLIALIAGLEFWRYVGGPTHLDDVPWFWKAILSLAIASTVVKITSSETLRKALTWVAVLAVLLIGCGLLSYYAHINEPQDESDDQQQNVPTLLRVHPDLPGSIRQLHE